MCINDRNEFDDEDGGEVQIELGLWLIIMKEIVEIRFDSFDLTQGRFCLLECRSNDSRFNR